MSMKRNSYLLLLLSTLCLNLNLNAHAEKPLPISQQPAGIQDVFNLIRNVNLTQNDLKVSQPILELLDFKEQMYELRPISNTAAVLRPKPASVIAAQGRKKPGL